MARATTDARSLLTSMYRALRIIRLHPIETLQVRETLDRLQEKARTLRKKAGRLELRVVRQSLYLNEERLESDIENYVFYDHVLTSFRNAGVGVLRVDGPTSRDWQSFLSLVVRAGPDEDPTKTEELARQMVARSVRGLEVAPPVAGTADLPGEVERREAAKRTYRRSVAVSKDLFNGARLGRGASVKEVKHAVQNIVDAVLNNEASLGGLSTLKDYDDYSFTHSVNVCIFCVAIGKRLGLSKVQLYDLGLAALVHDLGMSRIPHEILTKGSALSPDERRQMESHTYLGALSAYQLGDFGEIPFQSMIVAYEHHLKSDGSGYPRSVRPREPSVFSRIVSVAAAFDAATNERAYHPAHPPDEVLRELWENKSLGYDPVIVKALINLLGIYPVGTCVILDTYELALVHSANTDASYIHRPIVRLLCDATGTWLSPAPLVDLAATDDAGTFPRSIIKVTSPEKYGIKVSDYFV